MYLVGGAFDLQKDARADSIGSRNVRVADPVETEEAGVVDRMGREQPPVVDHVLDDIDVEAKAGFSRRGILFAA